MVAIDIERYPVRRDDVVALHVELLASGVARLSGPRTWALNWDPAQQKRRLCTSFSINGPGEGTLAVTVTELNRLRRPVWAPSATLFLLQSPEVLLTYKSSGL